MTKQLTNCLDEMDDVNESEWKWKIRNEMPAIIEIEPWNLILSPSKSGASASIELVNSLQFCWRKKIRLEGTMQFLVSSQFGHGLGRARQFVSPDMSFIFELLIWNESPHKKNYLANINHYSTFYLLLDTSTLRIINFRQKQKSNRFCYDAFGRRMTKSKK